MNNVVRLSAAALLGAALTAAAASPAPKVHPRPYGRGKAYYHKTAVAPYRFRNTTIRLSFDFPRGTVFGDVTDLISPKTAGLKEIALNSVGLHYNSVTVNGERAAYHVAGDHVYIELAHAASAGDTLAVEAKYMAHPVRGIYFIRPDRYYPHMQPEIWSQGEAEDNRRWFPTWDEPNQKTPVEQFITVKKGWEVTANGHLKSQTTHGASTTWDWREPQPISTYLIAFSAGPYVKFHTQLGSTPVDYFTSKTDAKWATLCFGRTKDIIAFFQSRIGVAYPWEKYDQTTVERFTAGGMENASATTQTEFAIHPPQYDLEQPCDGLVSHELSHQWWGDDVTTADWPNIWINEGYATYFEEMWAQHHFGEAQFEYERYHAQQSYFGETKRYWRPIVDYTYAQAMDSFDSSGYPRPGQVLHMLRYMYGDQRFFHALQQYLLHYRHKNADTQDFFASIDKTLGQNLDWFEHEWFFRAAYPDFHVKQRYDAASKTLTLDIAQRNHDGQPFRMPISIAVYANGKSRTTRFVADANHQVVRIAGVQRNPAMVLFDPNNNVLRGLTFAKSVSGLGYQALHAPYVGDRLWAIAQLGNAKHGDAASARKFVRDAVTKDPFYGVRVDALDAAASLDDAETIRLALHDSDPRVAIAAGDDVENLDHAGSSALASDLRALAQSSNPLLAGAALRGLGATKAPGTYALLVAGLTRHAFREPIARGALAGLASLGDLRAVPLMQLHAAYGIDESERPDALAALGKIGKAKPALVEPYLLAIARHDPYYRARGAAVRALGRLKQPSAIPALERIERTDSEQNVQNGAWDAIQDIKDRTPRAAGRKPKRR